MVFKVYDHNLSMLLPRILEDFLPSEHPAHIAITFLDKIINEPILTQYTNLEKTVHENNGFMWISGIHLPGHKTKRRKAP